MSHLRISARQQYGPLIPPAKADLVIALEPVEAARVLGLFGNPRTSAVVNSRPVYPVDVISGDIPYPDMTALMETIRSISEQCHFLPATEKALELGNPILSNIILIGYAAGAGLLPITLEGLENAITDYLSPEKVAINREAFLSGTEMVT